MSYEGDQRKVAAGRKVVEAVVVLAVCGGDAERADGIRCRMRAAAQHKALSLDARAKPRLVFAVRARDSQPVSAEKRPKRMIADGKEEHCPDDWHKGNENN